jgi:hypothetical protein
MNSFRPLVYPSAEANATGSGCRDSGLVQASITELHWLPPPEEYTLFLAGLNSVNVRQIRHPTHLVASYREA